MPASNEQPHWRPGLGRPPKLADHVCRAIRLERDRAALGRLLDAFLVEVPDVVARAPHGLQVLAGYRSLEREGLVHVEIVQSHRRFTILAATSRVLRKPALRRRLFALKSLARKEYGNVVIATPKGLLHGAARLRVRRCRRRSCAPSAAGGLL